MEDVDTVLVAGERSDEVTVLQLDPASGKAVEQVVDSAIPAPACVLPT